MARKTKPMMTELEDVELGEKTKIEVWTDRVLIVGDAHIPHSIRGMKDRLSDLLNQPGKSFLSLTNVTLSSLSKRRLWRGDFLVVNKASIVLVMILKEEGTGGPCGGSNDLPLVELCRVCPRDAESNHHLCVLVVKR